jgi:hypothetical protein
MAIRETSINRKPLPTWLVSNIAKMNGPDKKWNLK